MFKGFIAELKNSKLPTILLITTLFVFSFYFLKDQSSFTPSAILGGIIAVVAIILSIFAFNDYRTRENIDHIISKYKQALNSFSLINKKYSKAEETMASKEINRIGKEEKGHGYIMENNTIENTSDN